MAPLKSVRSLYDICSEIVANRICFKLSSEEFEVWRKHLITVLPGSIRTALIDRAINSPCFPEFMNVVALLGDPSIKEICVSRKECSFWMHVKQLCTILHTSNITGLHELQLTEIRPPLESDGVISGLHKALSQGLASNLRVLSLRIAADNRTLKIIGSQALHLAQLDITSSWSVDDTGIVDLLIKDADGYLYLPWPELENRNLSAIEDISELPRTKLNRTCDTLYEVKIQDTNTTSVSVILLLLFAKKLESFGGFLYNRNIGDTVLSVQERKHAPSHLALSQLWDMDLPQNKLEKLVRSLPKLTRLYTRMIWLPQVPNVIPPLTQLIVDFDFVHYRDQFFNFLSYYGRTLKKLILIDQVYRLDLVSIACYCPVLEVMSANVYIEKSVKRNTALLQCMTTAAIGISSPETFLWFMRHAENIKYLSVLCENDNGMKGWFDISVITALLNENPKSLCSITHLSLKLSLEETIGGMLQIEAAEMLCSASNSLNFLGELDTWHHVTEEDVLMMAKKIKMLNWDVKLVYDHNFYPSS